MIKIDTQYFNLHTYDFSQSLHIQVVQAQVNALQHLLQSIAERKEKWEKQLEDAQAFLRSLPASSLLVAAAATYSTCLPTNKQQELWESWLGYCKGSWSLGCLQPSHSRSQFDHMCTKPNILIQDSFTFEQALSCNDELVKWKQFNLFPHSTILEKCLLLRAKKQFGNGQVHVVFDPHHQFKNYLTVFNTIDSEKPPSTLQEDTQNFENVLTFFLSELTNFEPLLESLTTGCIVFLVINTVKCISETVKMLFPLFQSHDRNSEFEINPGTQLFLIVHASLSNSQDLSPLTVLFQTLASFHIINLELDQQALCNLIHQSVLLYIRNDLCVQRRALLADLRLQLQIVQECQVCQRW